jgi:flavorubredoxin
MRKILKIVLVAVIIFIITAISSVGVIMADVAGNFATDVKALPNGAAIGKAIVIYNPGLSGGAKDVATKIGYNLQTSGYDVTLAGVKSSAATDLTGYDVIVIGGPIYAGKPSSSVQSYLNSLTPPAQTKVGVFGYGSASVDNTNSTAVLQDVAPLPNNSSVTFNAAKKVLSSGNIDNACAEFVSELLN